MKQKFITLKNDITGHIIKTPVGFSWTLLIFDFFVPLFRGDMIFAIFLGIIWFSGYAGDIDKFTEGEILVAFLFWIIFKIVFSIIYNEIYIKRMIEKGYLPNDNDSKEYLKFNGIILEEEKRKTK